MAKSVVVIYYSKTPPETHSTDQSTIVPSESPENTGCGTCGMSGTNFQEQQIICNDCIHRTRNAKSGVQCNAGKVQGAHPDCPDFAGRPSVQEEIFFLEEKPDVCKTCHNYNYDPRDAALCGVGRTQNNNPDCPDYDYDPDPVPI